jgi:hypothetical protein
MPTRLPILSPSRIATGRRRPLVPPDRGVLRVTGRIHQRWPQPRRAIRLVEPVRRGGQAWGRHQSRTPPSAQADWNIAVVIVLALVGILIVFTGGALVLVNMIEWGAALHRGQLRRSSRARRILRRVDPDGGGLSPRFSSPELIGDSPGASWPDDYRLGGVGDCPRGTCQRCNVLLLMRREG